MRLRALLILGLFLAAALWLFQTSSSLANQPRTVALFYTGYVHGSFGPCG